MIASNSESMQLGNYSDRIDSGCRHEAYWDCDGLSIASHLLVTKLRWM